MTHFWQPGDAVALRGIYNQRVWYLQSAIVVRDQPDEVALAMLPGAECMAPIGYINGKHGPNGKWDRWGDYLNDHWIMDRYNWHTNRLLILLQPERYYATIYFWHNDTDEFLCFYTNFQLPFRRSALGFDTFDLELDIVVEPDYEWHWKDEDDYHRGIERGIFPQEWVREIDTAKQEVLEKIEERLYPYDGSWLDWRPDPAWTPPTLSANWDKI